MSLATASSKILRSTRAQLRAESFRPMTVLSKQSAEEYKKQNYTTRQKELGRPVSPHVTIYAFPVGGRSSSCAAVLTIGATVCLLILAYFLFVGSLKSSHLFHYQSCDWLRPVLWSCWSCDR